MSEDLISSYDNEMVPTATHQIYQFVDEYLSRKEKDTNINRASAANMCFKRRWFQGNGFEGEKLTPRKILNFMLGDLTEHTVKYFIANGCVGPGKLYSEVDFGKEIGSFTVQGGKKIMMHEQETTFAVLQGIKISAHADGWGKRNSDGAWELIEVKSAADYGYEEFKESGPGDYLKQAMVNLSTDKAMRLGAKDVRFFYMKKNTGNIWDKIYPFDKSILDKVSTEYVVSNQNDEPKTPNMIQSETFRNKPTGRAVLNWRCGYCPYTLRCHPNAKLEFKNGKPKYYV